MFIIKKINNKILKSVAKMLASGAIVVYPTDTAYGLGCDATNAEAVAKIFKIKSREKTKALPMIVADIEMAEKFFLFATRHLPFAKRHWPGPLSMIVKAKKGIVKAALSKGTAAVRVPDSRVARTIAKYLGRPLIATSANISGRPTCYSIKAYLRQTNVIARSSDASVGATKQSPGDRHARRGSLAMTIKPDAILDAGALRRRRPSTIVKVNEKGDMEVLRKGPIKI